MFMDFWCIVYFILIMLNRVESLETRKDLRVSRPLQHHLQNKDDWRNAWNDDYDDLNDYGIKEEEIALPEISNVPIPTKQPYVVKKNVTDMPTLENRHSTTVSVTLLNQRMSWLIIITSFSLISAGSVISLCFYHRHLRKFKDKNNNNIQSDNYVKSPHKKRIPENRSSNSLAPERYVRRYQKRKDNDTIKLFSIESDEETNTTDEETIIFDIDNIP